MSIDKWMDKDDVVHIYNGILAIKKNKIMPFAVTWIETEIITLSESERKTNIKWYHLYLESKLGHKWAYPQKRNRITENKPVVAKGEGFGGEGNTRISRCKLLYTGWINSKVLLCSAGNYIQDPVINHNGKNVYMCIIKSLCCTTETGTTL